MIADNLVFLIKNSRAWLFKAVLILLLSNFSNLATTSVKAQGSPLNLSPIVSFLLDDSSAPIQVACSDATFIGDRRYSDNYDRSLLDIWLPEDLEQPIDIVVYFHSGGFVGGDKTRIVEQDDFVALTDQGMAFASVGYPLVEDLANSTTLPADREIIMDETELAIEFLKQQSCFNINPSRMIFAGASAGNTIAENLAYVRGFEALAVLGIQQPLGSDLILDDIVADIAPLYLFTQSGPDDPLHHPDNAQLVKDRCDMVGAECYLYGSPESGLPLVPNGEGFIPFAIESIIQP